MKRLVNGTKAHLNPPPLWIMRQAGRCLPEYHEIRNQMPDFMDLCFNPEIVTELTLQPIKRFGFDGAIIFSDILTIPHALGQKVVFQPKPTLAPLDLTSIHKNYESQKFLRVLKPVYKALGLIKERLSPTASLIGFAGSPWTVGSYMAEEPEQHQGLIYLLTLAIRDHLRQQIIAGADIIQIFDSWSAICPPELQKALLIAPIAKIIEDLTSEFPETPIIYYSREVPNVAKELQAKFPQLILSLDHTISLGWIQENLSDEAPVQGNLDPEILVQGGEKLRLATKHIRMAMEGRPFIFNLGHGILPHTPLENIYDLVKWVRAANA